MSIPAVDILWAALVIMVALSALAVFTFALITLHGRKIRESENKFRLLFERVLSPIILIDREYRLVDANRAFCALLGYCKEELGKTGLEELIPRERWPAVREELVKCLASGIEYSGETYLIGKDGNLIQAEIGGTVHKTNGDTHILISFKDIGAYKKVEEALKEKNSALREVLAYQEEEKVKYKREIAKTIDHVLSPILNRIVKEDGTISAGHLNSLQENLAALAAESGGISHTMGKLTPRELEVCNLLKTGATSKDIADTLNISIPTVNKHRERIRKKLVISKKDINLSTYLRKN